MNGNVRWMTMLAVAAMVLGGPVIAHAEDPGYIPDEIQEGEDDGTGWAVTLSASANLSMNHNHNVVGNTNGLSFTGGFLLNGGVGFLSKNRQHEWRNSLGWALTYTRTPTVPKFFKSIDRLDFETMYLWHPPKAPWIGPFVGIDLNTPVLPGYVIYPEDVQVDKAAADGTAQSSENVTALDRIDLTNAFAPLTLRESVGMFVLPVEKTEIRVEIRAGVGAWETFTQDGYIVVDDEDTDPIELQQLQDSVQFGAEASVAASGTVKEFMTYGARAAMMQPFVHNVETDLEGAELMNLDFEVRLGFKLTKWASLDYQFKAFKTPLVYDGWQVQNGLLVTLTANIVDVDKKKSAAEQAAAANEAAEAAAAAEQAAAKAAEEAEQAAAEAAAAAEAEAAAAAAEAAEAAAAAAEGAAEDAENAAEAAAGEATE